jgi:predicted aldo/keto reductase-like oxidoreductase
MKTSRRAFLQSGSALAALGPAAVLGSPLGDQDSNPPDPARLPGPLPTTRKGDMLYRRLGRTGEHVSIVGIGGSHLSWQRGDDEAVRIVRAAVDRGITFMDNCWDYGPNGLSEIRMGKALQEGYRSKVFLMTKFDGHTREKAQQQLEDSLRRLQTDHIDLWQLHENIRMGDPEAFFAPGGAVEAVLEAKRAGKIRYAGFTGHKDPQVHARMLELARQHRFHFDAAQMPINVMDAHFKSFIHEVVPEMMKRGVALLGMKSMGAGAILASKVVTPIECLHFAMSMPTSVVITGIQSLDLLDQACEAVKTFKPLTYDQLAELLGRTRAVALTGKYEPFKTTDRFDATSRNPGWVS